MPAAAVPAATGCSRLAYTQGIPRTGSLNLTYVYGIMSQRACKPPDQHSPWTVSSFDQRVDDRVSKLGDAPLPAAVHDQQQQSTHIEIRSTGLSSDDDLVLDTLGQLAASNENIVSPISHRVRPHTPDVRAEGRSFHAIAERLAEIDGVPQALPFKLDGGHCLTVDG